MKSNFKYRRVFEDLFFIVLKILKTRNLKARKVTPSSTSRNVFHPLTLIDIILFTRNLPRGNNNQSILSVFYELGITFSILYICIHAVFQVVHDVYSSVLQLIKG